MTSLRKYNTDPTVAPKALHRFRPEDVHICTGEGDRLQVTPSRGLALSADERRHVPPISLQSSRDSRRRGLVFAECLWSLHETLFCSHQGRSWTVV